jgi:hypothetical protein
METALENGSKDWRRFLRKHWHVFVVFVVGAVTAAVGAAYVFLWFVGNAQSGGLVPWALAQWTPGNAVAFALNLLFWELLLIGVPVILAAIGGWLWWRKSPVEEREGCRFPGGRALSERRRGGLIRVLDRIPHQGLHGREVECAHLNVDA